VKKKLLFLCTGNSCRSQIAEGLGNKYLSNFIVSSAGTSPNKVNNNAINCMKEIDIDISLNTSKKLNLNKLNVFDLVITLCGDVKDKCPIINNDKHIHWDIPDPAKFAGNDKEISIEFSRIRDIIYNYIILLENN